MGETITVKKSAKIQLSQCPYSPATQATCPLQMILLTVVASIVVEPLGIEMDNISAHIIQETLVMGDNQQCLPPALKIAVFREE